MKRLGLWVLDHYISLVCFGVGTAAGFGSHRPVLAMSFYTFGALAEVARTLTEVQRDVAALREDARRRHTEHTPA